MTQFYRRAGETTETTFIIRLCRSSGNSSLLIWVTRRGVHGKCSMPARLLRRSRSIAASAHPTPAFCARFATFMMASVSGLASRRGWLRNLPSGPAPEHSFEFLVESWPELWRGYRDWLESASDGDLTEELTTVLPDSADLRVPRWQIV